MRVSKILILEKTEKSFFFDILVLSKNTFFSKPYKIYNFLGFT